jgi:cytidine deaminase
VAITQLDSIKNTLGAPVTFEYLDLSVGDKEEFGAKKALPLPSTSARAFSVGVSHVGFADGTVWNSENTDWQSAAENSAVMRILAAEETYKKAIALIKSGEKENILKAKGIFESIAGEKDVEAELGICAQKLAEFDVKEEKKLAAKKSRKKIWKILAIILSSLLVFVLLMVIVVVPFVAYSTGNYQQYIRSLWHQGDSFEVPNGVDTIQYCAFSYCSELKSVTLPDTVIRIEDYAFEDCYNLEEVNLPDNVSYIGVGAFSHCYGLNTIVIPDSVTEIEVDAFFNCGLETIYIGEGIRNIKLGTFSYNWSLTTIYIGSNVEHIGFAFDSCPEISSIHFNGTMEQWNSIEKEFNWDAHFRDNNYIVHCADGIITQ